MSQTVVIDIGNTSICIGFFSSAAEIRKFRIPSNRALSQADYESAVRAALQSSGIELPSENNVAIASVVPDLNVIFDKISSDIFQTVPIYVTSDLCGGIKLNVPHPESVGADRIANSVAAGEIYSKPALVVDFGTATTFDVIGPEGSYEGGVIAPGPETALAALVRNTAKLSSVDLSWPDDILGKTTESAMRSGLVMGYMDLVDGIISRLIKRLGNSGKIIATGGLARLFASHSVHISIYDEDLTLKGIKRISDHAHGF